MSKLYAIISKVRKQVVNLKEDTKGINPDFNLIVDISEHPQKDEVKLDCFYDEATNEFSSEGEVYYPVSELEPEPEPEPEPESLTDMEQAVLDTAINTEYLVCLADMGL